MSRTDAVNSPTVRALVFSGLALWLVGTLAGKGWMVGVAAVLIAAGGVAYVQAFRRRQH